MDLRRKADLLTTRRPCGGPLNVKEVSPTRHGNESAAARDIPRRQKLAPQAGLITAARFGSPDKSTSSRSKPGAVQRHHFAIASGKAAKKHSESAHIHQNTILPS